MTASEPATKEVTKQYDVDNVSDQDGESATEKLPYPKSVFFIVSNEFCERFSYYGMRTILILYLTDILKFTEPKAKITYHAFSMLVYFFPVIGGIICDSWLGKFRTIFYVSMIYASGSILLALTAINSLGIPQTSFTVLALILIAMGTGGIKPCVLAFGGDQFVIPQQEVQLATFFSLFYFAINAGGLLSTFLTPILRKDVHCFGNENCYPLAFAIPGILMVISIVIFASGKPLYKIKKPKGNIIVDVTKCISYAVTHRKKGPPVDHWLDRAAPKYGTHLVSEVKSLLRVLVLYIPLPIFFTLYDQQGSGWTFQAVRMDGNIGFYTILPDQMQVIDPLLILGFIPLFTYGVYPLLAKCHLLRTPLQRMCCGGFMVAVAFVVSAGISILLENTDPVLPSTKQAQVRIYDTQNCNYSFASEGVSLSGQMTDGYYINKDVRLSNKEQFVTVTFNCSSCPPKTIDVNMTEGTAYYLNVNIAKAFEDDVAKSDDGKPRVRTLVSDATEVIYQQVKKDLSVVVPAGNDSLISMSVGKYTTNVNGAELEFKLGGTYTVLINKALATVQMVTVTNPNSVHMLWLLPQYFIITAAEIMFIVTGLELSYSQAPASMKSVLQACFLLTDALGNLIIVLIESAGIFKKQSNDFFLYAGLMVVDMLIFVWLAVNYKYVTNEESSTIEQDELETEEYKKETHSGIDNLTYNNSNAAD